jgi:hypothetical protein
LLRDDKPLWHNNNNILDHCPYRRPPQKIPKNVLEYIMRY